MLHYSSMEEKGLQDDSSTAKPPPYQLSEENSIELNGESRQYKGGFDRKEIIKEVKTQVWLAGPLIGTTLLQFCLHLVSLMFIGHISELALSAASIAVSFTSVCGYSFLMGIAGALDTLCGQSYGAKQYHMLGIHLQRGIIVQFLVSIVLSSIWANTGLILRAVHQDPDISREAGIFAQLLIPSTFAFGILQCIIRFLQTQSIVFPMVLISGVALLLHIPVCWLMIFKSGLGFKGAAVANLISYWSNVLLFALYVKFSPSCARTWTGFSKDALNDIISYLRLAIPSALMVCLEMWTFELMVLLAGLLPNPKLETSVLAITFNTAELLFMITFGLSGAVSTRVSNELGAGNSKAARLAVIVVVAMAVVEGIVVGLILILIRNIWGYAYSKERDVIRYVATMFLILAVSNFINGVQCVLSGTIRGCGWQKIGAYVNLTSYYLVGLPVAVLLAFVFDLRGKGLWLGMLLALFVQVITYLVITVRTNWEKEAKKATERVHNLTIPLAVVST